MQQHILKSDEGYGMLPFLHPFVVMWSSWDVKHYVPEPLNLDSSAKNVYLCDKNLELFIYSH